ncbi:response regulator [Bryobacter aggregatus]|uniref:GGDEF domain-containing response regulator n=1 Tax=Bryobacter aggregatus TaxID=360054 RepID=UPI0004E23B97|nr:response regulator [Bryobacter aggregatus]
MRKKLTRILLLEDNMADAGLVREALAELEELQNGNTWLSPYELCDAESLSEALLLLNEISFDVILADLWVPDSAGIGTFQRLKAAAAHTPILIIANTEDPALTVRLVQEGAQDVLVKHEVDCTPLGRALRCAIERNRISTGLRRLSVRDELTGLLNFTGFVQLGEPFCRLMGRRESPAACAMLCLANLDAVSEIAGRHEEEWLLVETAELLRISAGDIDLASYLGRGRFALLSPDRDATELYEIAVALRNSIRGKAIARGTPLEVQIEVAAAQLSEHNSWQLEGLLDEAEDGLWENRRFETSCETSFDPADPAAKSLIH